MVQDQVQEVLQEVQEQLRLLLHHLLLMLKVVKEQKMVHQDHIVELQIQEMVVMELMVEVLV